MFGEIPEPFMGPNHSLPSQSAVFTLRLLWRGDVAVSGMACEDGFREQAIRLATETAIDLYDEVYPDAALAAEAFIEESIATVRQFAAIHARPHLEAGMGKLLAPDELLPSILASAKTELGRTGEVVQRIGWHVRNAMASIAIGTAPYERYRYFRAVSEVARRVDADAVVYLSNAHQLGPNFPNTDIEVLGVMWINPDGTCVSKCVSYTRRTNPQLKHDIAHFWPEDASAQISTTEPSSFSPPNFTFRLIFPPPADQAGHHYQRSSVLETRGMDRPSLGTYVGFLFAAINGKR